jgi:hypothetical protein
MSTQQASSELMRLINGYQISQVIHVAASLGIADLLKDGPRLSAEIAEATGAHALSMYRLLHALASAGVVEEQSDSRFSLTDIGECLRSDSPHSRVAWARIIGRPYIWQSWGELRHCVTTGEPAFEHLHGVRLWEWRAKRPEEARLAGAAQSEVSRDFFEAIVDAFDFSRFRCIVDVGGGQGQLLGGILARHPGSKGILYDVPEIVTGAPAVLRAHGVAGRCEAVGGDMFRSVPQGGDAYLLTRVLLDHADAKVSTILRACRLAMGATGRLIVIERITEPNRPQLMLVDITMLVMSGGRERTLAEFTAVFAEAGFELEQTVATRSPFTMLIGVPV